MHQLFGLLSSTDGYADACGGVKPVPINIGDRDTQLRLEALCDPNRSAGIGDVLQQDGELIPADRTTRNAEQPLRPTYKAATGLKVGFSATVRMELEVEVGLR